MSLIKKIHIENFMSIGNADIEFDKSNIIDLCGYNDSGKSAVIRLIDIMLYNAYPTEQVHFIKNDEDYFKCIMYFDDDVEYERIKVNTGASIFSLRKNGVEIYTNQSGRQVINTGGIPKVIEDYLGVIKDEYTKEELNVRRCTDRLFLINTTGGDNYKILNTVLQSEALAETSNRLNIDKNKLQNEVIARYNQLSALHEQRKENKVVPEDMIDKLECETNKLEEIHKKYSDIENINDIEKILDGILISKEVSSIDIGVFDDIHKVKVYKEESEKGIPVKVNTVDIKVIEEITKIRNLKSESHILLSPKVSSIDIGVLDDIQIIKEQKDKYNNIMVFTEISGKIDINMYNDIKELAVKLSEYESADGEYYDINFKYLDVYNKLQKLADEYNLAICKNCGTVMVGGHTHE